MGRLDYLKEYKSEAAVIAASTKEVLFKSRVYRAGGSTAVGTYTPLPYDTVEFESTPSWNNSLFRWVTPASITSTKRGYIICNANTTSQMYFAVYKNGSLYKYGSFASGGNRETSMIPIHCVAGDYFEIINVGNNMSINTVSSVNWAEMVLYKDPDINGKGIILRSLAYRVGGIVNLGNNLVKVPYNTLDVENVTTFDSANNRWVVPTITGTKRGYILANALFSGGLNMEMQVWKNGSLYKRGGYHWIGTTSVTAVPVECVTGDIFEIFVARSGNIEIDGNPDYTWAELTLFADPILNTNQAIGLISDVNRNFLSPVNIGTEPALFPYNNIVYESLPTFDTANSRWIIPASVTTPKKGYIFWNYQLASGSGASYGKVHKNGSIYRHGGYTTDNLPNNSVIPITAVAGDIFEIKSEHTGSVNAEGGIDQNWATLILLNDELAVTGAANYLPTTLWEIGIPVDSLKQVHTSRWVQNGNVVTVWGSMTTKFDNPTPSFDISVPVTNGNPFTAISGVLRKQRSTEQLSFSAAVFGAPTTKVHIGGSGITNTANEVWDFKFTYTLT